MYYYRRYVDNFISMALVSLYASVLLAEGSEFLVKKEISSNLTNHSNEKTIHYESSEFPKHLPEKIQGFKLCVWDNCSISVSIAGIKPRQ